MTGGRSRHLHRQGERHASVQYLATTASRYQACPSPVAANGESAEHADSRQKETSGRGRLTVHCQGYDRPYTDSVNGRRHRDQAGKHATKKRRQSDGKSVDPAHRGTTFVDSRARVSDRLRPTTRDNTKAKGRDAPISDRTCSGADEHRAPRASCLRSSTPP